MSHLQLTVIATMVAQAATWEKTCLRLCLIFGRPTVLGHSLPPTLSLQEGRQLCILVANDGLPNVGFLWTELVYVFLLNWK